MKSKRVKIEVTKWDIQRGRAGTADFCPVSRGVNRVLKRRFSAFSGLLSINIFFRNGTQGFQFSLKKTPAAAARFIARFDAGQPVKPFSFCLSLPVEVLRTPRGGGGGE